MGFIHLISMFLSAKKGAGNWAAFVLVGCRGINMVPYLTSFEMFLS